MVVGSCCQNEIVLLLRSLPKRSTLINQLKETERNIHSHADRVATHCTRYGKDNDNPCVFTTLFSHNAAEMIKTHTTEQLVKDGYEPLTVLELYQFVATMLILSRFRMPT